MKVCCYGKERDSGIVVRLTLAKSGKKFVAKQVVGINPLLADRRLWNEPTYTWPEWYIVGVG